MKINWTKSAIKDLEHWQKTDRDIEKRIKTLIKDIENNLFTGIGKPEPLRGNYSGKWSRRITGEHRLIYEVKNQEIIIFSCRYHYYKN